MKKRINLITVLLCWATSLYAQNSFWEDLKSVWIENSVGIVLIFLTIGAIAAYIIFVLRNSNLSVEQIRWLPYLFVVLGVVFMIVYVAFIYAAFINSDKVNYVGLICMLLSSIALILVSLFGFPSDKKSKNSSSSTRNQKIKGMGIGDNSDHDLISGQIIHQNNNNMEKRYQVFISSTFVDLEDERGKVMEAILNLDCFPAGMELFPAMDEEQFEYIKKIIDQSDYYLLIIGGRYGSEDDSGVSWTEREFDYAVSKGKDIHIIVFDHKDFTKLPVSKTDQNDKKRDKLVAFKKKASKGRLIRQWTNVDDLAYEVAKSLPKVIKQHPGRGWVRAAFSKTISSKKEKKTETKLEKKVAKDSQIEYVKGKPSSGQHTIVSFTVKDVDFKMVLVKGGTFIMGARGQDHDPLDKDAKPAHSVTLTDYWIGETQVTQELWEAVMEENPSRFEKNPICPVEYVSWNMCQKFIERLNDTLKEKLKDIGRFSLPTEAQWEFAARGGNLGNHMDPSYSGRTYDLKKVAYYVDNSDHMPHPVAELEANELGLYDMSGNVWEWCEDKFGPYSSDSQIDPKGAETDDCARVRRGGGWGASEKYCRVSYRRYDNPSEAYDYVGLRLALVPIHK